MPGEAGERLILIEHGTENDEQPGTLSFHGMHTDIAFKLNVPDVSVQFLTQLPVIARSPSLELVLSYQSMILLPLASLSSLRRVVINIKYRGANLGVLNSRWGLGSGFGEWTTRNTGASPSQISESTRLCAIGEKAPSSSVFCRAISSQHSRRTPAWCLVTSISRPLQRAFTYPPILSPDESTFFSIVQMVVLTKL